MSQNCADLEAKRQGAPLMRTSAVDDTSSPALSTGVSFTNT